MKNQKNKVYVFLISLIILSCLEGFFLNLLGASRPYNPPRAAYHYYFNTLYSQLKNSEAVKALKSRLPEDITVGYFSDVPVSDYIMFIVLQNLLVPELLDRDNPRSHEYIIMYLKNNDPAAVASSLKRKIIGGFGQNLYLAAR